MSTCLGMKRYCDLASPDWLNEFDVVNEGVIRLFDKLKITFINQGLIADPLNKRIDVLESNPGGK